MRSSSLNNLLLSPTASTSSAPPPAARLPYAPTKRVSRPDSVLTPITRLELVQSQSSVNPLRTRPIGSSSSSSAPASAGSRGGNALPSRPEQSYGAGVKRDESDAWVGRDDAHKRAREDVRAVASHYNARPNVGRVARNDSPIIGLKNFNNWVKSVLIAKFGRGAGGAQSVRGGIKVLDIGCGKGGDLQKWAKAGVEEYIGIDLAEVSVEQARSRWQNMGGRSRFAAEFFALDCYEQSISEVIDPLRSSRPADVISMQFCMHYAFESEHKARQMLQNVTQYLRPGGIFLGTIPDSSNLLARLDEVDEEGPLEFGNEVYKIRFDQRDWDNQFGHRYTFFLQDAVEEVPEYVVYWEAFVDIAREYGLEAVFHADFQQIFMQEKEVKEFAELLTRMKVVDATGNTEMTFDQWEAANLYIGFAFKKKE